MLFTRLHVHRIPFFFYGKLSSSGNSHGFISQEDIWQKFTKLCKVVLFIERSVADFFSFLALLLHYFREGDWALSHLCVQFWCFPKNSSLPRNINLKSFNETYIQVLVLTIKFRVPKYFWLFVASWNSFFYLAPGL